MVAALRVAQIFFIVLAYVIQFHCCKTIISKIDLTL